MDIMMESYLDVWRNWNNFQGRTRRSGFWYVILANIIIGIIFGILMNISGIFSSLSGLYSLAFFIPSLALSIRRLHDVGRSGWWLFLYLVPLVGAILLLVWYCTDSGPDNQYGPSPKGYGSYQQGGYQQPYQQYQQPYTHQDPRNGPEL